MLPHLVVSLALTALLQVPALASTAEDSGRVLAEVNGEPITEGDLRFLLLSRNVPPERHEQARERLLEQLIHRRLMRAYLADRQAEADSRELDRQVRFVYDLIRRKGDDPQQVLSGMGYTEERLREELALPLSWQAHARRIITTQQLREYYAEHRQQFDGTEVRASQIFLKLPADAEPSQVEAAEQKLKQIRADIQANELSFAEAARQHSQSPSRDQGGDVGCFPFRGKMPAAFADVAFGLQKGEISGPFRTPFGMHLVTVTERKPGELSLEDARTAVFERLADEQWNKTVADLREKAKIQYSR